MRHGLATRLLAGVAVVGLLGALLVIVTSPGGESESAATTSTTASAELDPAARELLDLLDRGRSTTYHARYEGTSPDVEGTIVLETWQSPPRIRQDSELQAEGQAVRTRTLGDEEGVVRCGQVEGTWTCTSTPGAADPLGPVDRSAIEQLTRGSVGVRHTSVSGRAARCFTLRVAEGSSELCASDDGIVLRVSSAGSELALVDLDVGTDLGDDVFEPPAEVTA